MAREQLAIEEETPQAAAADNNGVAFHDAGASNKSKVTVVGSGNWGSVAAKLIASNALKLPSFHGTTPVLFAFLIFVHATLELSN